MGVDGCLLAVPHGGVDPSGLVPTEIETDGDEVRLEAGGTVLPQGRPGGERRVDGGQGLTERLTGGGREPGLLGGGAVPVRNGQWPRAGLLLDGLGGLFWLGLILLDGVVRLGGTSRLGRMRRLRGKDRLKRLSWLGWLAGLELRGPGCQIRLTLVGQLDGLATLDGLAGLPRTNRLDRMDRMARLPEMRRLTWAETLARRDRLTRVSRAARVPRLSRLGWLARMERLPRLPRLSRPGRLGRVDRLAWGERLPRAGRLPRLEWLICLERP